MIDNQMCRQLAKLQSLIKSCEHLLKERKKYEIKFLCWLIFNLIFGIWCWFSGLFWIGAFPVVAALFFLALIAENYKSRGVINQLLTDCLTSKSSKPYRDIKENQNA